MLAQRAVCICRYTHLAYAHKHSIVHYPAALCCVPESFPAPRPYVHKYCARMHASAVCAAQCAGTLYCTRAACGAGTRFSSMPAQSSGQATQAWAKLVRMVTSLILPRCWSTPPSTHANPAHNLQQQLHEAQSESITLLSTVPSCTL